MSSVKARPDALGDYKQLMSQMKGQIGELKNKFNFS
jgi:hypothetical protein